MRARANVVAPWLIVLCVGCGGGSSDGTSTGGASGSGGSGASGGSGGTSNGGSGNGGTSNGGSGGGTAGSGAVGGSGGGEAWQPLIEGSWQLPSGTEQYWCVTKTLSEDVYVKAFRAQAPEGTHHTLLLYGNGGADGEFPCGPTLDDSMIYASGVGSDDLSFPPGVAVKLAAGTQILLNLHLFNTSPDAISGVSGTLVQTMPAAEVQQEAEMVLPGTMSILIPPQSEHTVSGTCQFTGTATISTVWPHMHKYGKHMKVVHQAASGDTTLHDGPYSFYEQKNYAITPVTVLAGESIRVECTFKNTTNQTITFGDSSEKEMCFAGVYRYPKLGTGCF